MAAILLAFQLAHLDHAPILKLFKYIVLALILAVSLNEVRRHPTKDTFIRGSYLGFRISAIAGLSVALLNPIIYAMEPELAFSKYMLEPHSALELATISFMLFLEILVIGSIISFIFLQYFKSSSRF